MTKEILWTARNSMNGTKAEDSTENSEFVGEAVAFPARVIFASVGSLMIVGGVVGHSMMLVVVYTLSVGRKVTGASTQSLFIISLAVADISSLLNWPVLLVLDMILGYHPVVNQARCTFTAVVGISCHIVSLKENRNLFL